MSRQGDCEMQGLLIKQPAYCLIQNNKKQKHFKIKLPYDKKN